ncbi:MAG: carboxypeptidase regulatory-like domain-containing protein [Bdellovibrionales bacterium]|nr:carboxypeptidase regulatory-like domain-containing protein [Bdellovibrionales bacterium]
MMIPVKQALKTLQFLAFSEPALQRARHLAHKIGFVLFAIVGIAACSKRTGVLYDQQGQPVPFQVVRLLTVDDAGEETQELAIRTTDSAGRFSFSLDPKANASVILESDLPQGRLRGFWAGRPLNYAIHPMTEALVSLIQDMTLTLGGRTTADFTPFELQDLGDAIFALNLGTLDLSNDEAVKDFIRTSIVARMIADAAGGQVNVISKNTFSGESTSMIGFSSMDSSCLSNAPTVFLNGSGFRFDFRSNGSPCILSNGALPPMLYEESLELKFNGEVIWDLGGDIFPELAIASTTLESGREIVLGPITLRRPQLNDMDPPSADDLMISRKIFVPENTDYARYLTILDNTTGANDRTLSIDIRSFLRTDENSSLLTHDVLQSIPNQEDRYVVAYDMFQERPTVGFGLQDQLGRLGAPTKFFSPGVAGGSVNEVTWGWNNLVIPAGTQKTILTYLFLTSLRDSNALNNSMQEIVREPNMTAMSLQELQGLLNFTPGAGTVIGEAGSVIGRADVTALNLDTQESLTVKARNDGSFFVPLVTNSGDKVKITSSDGLETTLTVP